MARQIKGEVGFKVDGEPHTLLLDFNALCDLEDDFPGLMDGTAQLKSPKAIRRVFHAGLAAYHPEVSEREAGAIIHAIGVEEAGDLVRRSFQSAFPDAKGGEEVDRPQKAPAKAGAGSAR